MTLSLKLTTASAALAAALFASPSSAVEIEYWQYFFDGRVKAVDQLIEAFEEQNPDITVKHTHFPYAQFRTKVAAAVPAGEGPDVMQFYYGWLPDYMKAGLIQPLSTETFPPAEIEEEFFPIVERMKIDGAYMGIPTAVRSLAMFYNKDLFEKAGLDPESPPATHEELVAAANAIAERDGGGNLLVAGITATPVSQDAHYWREVLIRQFGGQPYSDDYSEVAYDSEAGAAALEFYTALQKEEKVGTAGFMDEGQAAFRAGRAAMTIDGTFRLGSFSSIEDFEWGVAELPANAEGLRSNYASYFANAIGSGAEGEELEAAATFLDYLSSPEAMKLWLEVVGELPARRDVALTDENLADPIYGPFLKALDYAHTTRFVDEAAQRQVTIDMTNRVLLQDQSPADSVAEAAAAEQKIIDDAR